MPNEDSGTHRPADRTLIISYLTLRRSLGLFGVLLPLVLVLGDSLTDRWDIRPTISAYYYSGMGDVMVASMCAVGVFLITYTGYDAADNRISALAGVGIIGVGLLPTSNGCAAMINGGCIAQGQAPIWWMEWVGTAHDLSALLFIGMIGWLSLFQFTKSGPAPPTSQKIRRNQVYRTVATVIFICMGLLIARAALRDRIDISWLEELSFVFWVETVALVAFGFAWLTKGEILWPDRR